MPDSPLRLEAFTYCYPGRREPALRAIDLELAEGELVLVAGDSGGGKSTLLRAASGLVPHFYGGVAGGTVTVGGMDTRRHGPADLAAVAGSVFQDPESQIVMNGVRAELELPLEGRAGWDAGADRAVEETALALGLGDLLDRQTRTLSGGELQRTALAAALVTHPRLLLLDEPTSQLDPVAGDELISLLRRLNEQWGTTVVLAEHRIERCLPAADRVVVVEDAALCFDGSPREFVAWASGHRPALVPPAARMFAAAGRRDLPVGVKDARRMLAAEPATEHSLAAAPASPLRTGPPAPKKRRRRGAQASPALAMKGVWFTHDDGTQAGCTALRGVDFDLRPGERVALLGRNGAGKSTMLHIAAGLHKPGRGRVAAAGDVALVVQCPSDYFLHERVADELPGAAGPAALEALGLASLAGEDPRDLSGGERQRLALGIVLAGRGIGGGSPPAVIALDEPTRGMTRAQKDNLAHTLGTLADAGAAIVAATHDVEFAAELADRCVLLGRGRVVADGTAHEVLCGGLYFSTEVARVLGPGAGAILPAEGARLLSGAQRAGPSAAAPGQQPALVQARRPEAEPAR